MGSGGHPGRAGPHQRPGGDEICEVERRYCLFLGLLHHRRCADGQVRLELGHHALDARLVEDEIEEVGVVVRQGRGQELEVDAVTRRIVAIGVGVPAIQPGL